MKPRTPEVTPPQDDLFRSRLENLNSPRHPLVLLARRIDWEGLNTGRGAFDEDAVVGRPPKATRLMTGLLYLKHTYSLSDVSVPPNTFFRRPGADPMIISSPLRGERHHGLAAAQSA